MPATPARTSEPTSDHSTIFRSRQPALRRGADVVPIKRHKDRPSRINPAGSCVYCLKLDCKDTACIARHRLATWQVCPTCDGTTWDPTVEGKCNCTGGLVETGATTGAGLLVMRARPRPARLSFGGWCMWCLERWCISPDCIDRHARSTWEVCEDCDGRGDYDGWACQCIYGLMETNFTGTTRQ